MLNLRHTAGQVVGAFVVAGTDRRVQGTLVAADDDGGLYSLYDARVGGGLPDPPRLQAGCRAESCQGPSSEDPQLPSAASANPCGVVPTPSGTPRMPPT